MRQTFRLLLLSGAAFASILLSAAHGAESAQEPKPAAQEAIDFAAGDAQSFSGAFLAARTADVDNDYPTAIALYRMALQFEPATLEIRERLMLALLLNGEFEEGLKQAEALKDDSAVERITRVVRGLDALRKGRHDEAGKILAYEGVNDLDKLTHGLLLAWNQAGAGKTREAQAAVARLKGPDWYKVFTDYQLGALAIVAGDTEAARRHLNAAVTNREAVATAPDTFMRAVMALARLEAAAGNRQKALDAIAVGEGMVTSYAPLRALRQSIERGETPPQQVTNAVEGAASVLFSIGGALNRQGAEDMVSLYLQISQALDPKSADTLILLGGIAEKLKQPQRAIDFYSRVPADTPMRHISELQLGMALAETGKKAEARQHLKALVEADPSDMRSYLAYGSVLSDEKDYKAMAELYDKAAEVIGPVPTPGDWTIFFQRGIAYERLKEWDRAEPNFRRSLELNPDQPQVLNYLGYSLVDRNQKLDEALDLIRRAVEARPDDGYIVDSLGWAYYRLGRFEEAVTELERAVQLRAGEATLNDHLGDAYWRVGRRLEAIYQWRHALISESDEVDPEEVKRKIQNGLPDLPVVKLTAAGDSVPLPTAQTAEARPAPAAGTATETPADDGGAAAAEDADTAVPTRESIAPEPAAPQAEAADKPVERPVERPAGRPVAEPARPVRAEPPAAARPIRYRVRNGDSLWRISVRHFGTPLRIDAILKANPVLRGNPNRIRPGQVITIPPR